MTWSTEPLRYRRELDARLLQPCWPPGVSCRTFAIPDAPAVHALLRLSYAQGQGVADFAEWWGKLSRDDEFDPRLCLLAIDDEGAIVGVAQCWTSAYLKDLAVRPDRQGGRIGESLLRQVFLAFRERGATHLDLKVEAGNTGGIRFYQRADMRRVPLEG